MCLEGLTEVCVKREKNSAEKLASQFMQVGLIILRFVEIFVGA